MEIRARFEDRAVVAVKEDVLAVVRGSVELEGEIINGELVSFSSMTPVAACAMAVACAPEVACAMTVALASLV